MHFPFGDLERRAYQTASLSMFSAGRDKTRCRICRRISQMVKHSDNPVELFGNLLQCFKFLTFPCIIFNCANAFRERHYLPIII